MTTTDSQLVQHCNRQHVNSQCHQHLLLHILHQHTDPQTVRSHPSLTLLYLNRTQKCWFPKESDFMFTLPTLAPTCNHSRTPTLCNYPTKTQLLLIVFLCVTHKSFPKKLILLLYSLLLYNLIPNNYVFTFTATL